MLYHKLKLFDRLRVHAPEMLIEVVFAGPAFITLRALVRLPTLMRTKLPTEATFVRRFEFALRALVRLLTCMREKASFHDAHLRRAVVAVSGRHAYVLTPVCFRLWTTRSHYFAAR